MRTMRFLVLLLVPGLLLAACGSDDSKTSAGSSTSSSPSASTSVTLGGTTVKVNQTNLGDVLANSEGRTLYALSTETATNITCVGQCAGRWPPLVLTAGQNPTAGPGVTGALTLVTRPDGGRQVAYDSKPLYTFAGDAKAGDTLGEGVGGVWHVVKPTTTASGAAPAGQTATTAAGSTATSTATTKPSSMGGY